MLGDLIQAIGKTPFCNGTRSRLYLQYIGNMPNIRWMLEGVSAIVNPLLLETK